MSRTVAATLMIAASATGPPLVARLVVTDSPNFALWIGLLVQLGWLGFALGGALLTEARIPVAMGWVRGRLPWVAWLPAVLGFLCASLGIHEILVQVELRNVGQLAEIDRSLRQSQPVSPWLAPLVAGLLPGFAEESLFRGFVLGRLRLVAGPVAAVLGSAAVFGIAHFDWVHGTAAVALGLYLGTLALLARSVWPCVAAHACNNLLGVLSIQAASVPALAVAIPPLASLGASALLLVATALLMRSGTRRHREPASPATD